MSVLSVRNLQETFVGKNIARTANVQITDPTASAYIADGEVVVVNSTGAPVLASALNSTGFTYANSPFFQIVQRNGDNLVWSSKIYGNKVNTYKGTNGYYGQDQVYHIGYTGSGSSTLDITAGLDYQLTLIENQDDMMWAEQKKKNVTSVPNNLVTSQQDLAKAIVKNVMKKYTTDGISVVAAMVNSGTAAAVGSTTLKVVSGSPYIVYSATPTGVVTGSLLRIGTTGNVTTSNFTMPVYTVKEVNGNTVTLDMPYIGPSNAALASTEHGLIATAGAYWGVRFIGKPLPFRRDFFKLKRVAFTLQMSGFGATPITKTVDSKYCYGDGRLILEEESFSKGFEGALNRMSVPLPLANETFTADGTTTSGLPTNLAAGYAISAIASSGVYATVTCASHVLVPGQLVTLSGMSVSTWNGTYTVVATPLATTFTIIAPSSGLATATGTATGLAFGDAVYIPNTLYGAITVEHFSTGGSTIVASPNMPQMVKIFMPRGAAQGTTDNTTAAVLTALNNWTTYSPGAFTALVGIYS
jgi:hypothetical protein